MRDSDSLHSLADLQELEEWQLILEGGSALWWWKGWQPPGPGRGMPRTGICNVYNTEFVSSQWQTLSTYNSQPFPMSFQ